jgi:hypothetical protein
MLEKFPFTAAFCIPLLVSVAALAQEATKQSEAKPPRKPNIVFLLADDK